MVGKKRLLLAAATLASVGAVIALAVGVTFGFFSSTAGTNTSNFTSGTVTLTSSVNTTCSESNIVPGDSLSACVLSADYSGSVPARVALDVRIQYPTADVPLYGGDNVNGLTFTITGNDGTPVSYTVPTSASYTGGDCPALNTCWEAKNQLAVVGGGGANDGNIQYVSGDSTTFTAQPSFPTTVGNAFQNGDATLVMTAHAVQDAHQAAPGTPGQTDSSTIWS